MPTIEEWLVEQGLQSSSVAALLSGFAERLVAGGIPVVRVHLALPMVNPTLRARTFSWTGSTGTLVEGVRHDANESTFEASPFGPMLRNGIGTKHWHLEDPAAERFAIFDEVDRQGGTDYLAQLIRFDNPDAPGLRGIAIAFSTDRPGGLTAGEVARIAALTRLFALAVYRLALFDLTLEMLDTYVGLSAGRRVLSGEIRRGSGTKLDAALFFADLRGFTALADSAGDEVIARLGDHLEAMGEPVMEHGGEILKFLGDGLLAAFPITPERSQETACTAAVRAAQEALTRNAAVNGLRSGEMPLDLDIALHCGPVFYGNIGAAHRLDFTVIGQAVNEVSRIEALCSDLGTPLLMSSDVATASPFPTRSLGRHSLRGVAEQRELFTLAA